MEEKIRCVALAQKVLAVAVMNYRKDNLTLFDWAVYVDAVPGINHEQEKDRVADKGCKQGMKLASLLFPDLDKNLYRN